jgi:hypothetical protein
LLKSNHLTHIFLISDIKGNTAEKWLASRSKTLLRDNLTDSDSQQFSRFKRWMRRWVGERWVRSEGGEGGGGGGGDVGGWVRNG